jgi:hypothetical protein
VRHATSYHAYARSTPVIDAIGSIVAVASVLIGTYALLFLGFAVDAGNTVVAFHDGLVLAGVVVANGLFQAMRHWIRHHG